MSTAYRLSRIPATTESVLLTQIGSGTPKANPRNWVFTVPSYQTKYEMITPNSEGSHRMWKSFQHYKIVPGEKTSAGNMGGLTILTNSSYPSWAEYGVGKHTYLGAELKTSGGSTIRPYGDPGELNQSLPAFRVAEGQTGVFIPAPSDLDKHTQRALNVMLPAIKAELSLVNSLIELKDFKKPVKKVLDFFRTPKGWKLFALAQQRNRALKELDVRAAGAYLEYKFNISPLISDIAGIYRALSTARSQINALISRVGRVQRRHYAFNWYEFPAYSYETYPTPGYLDYVYQLNPGCLYRHHREVRTEPSSFHAMIEYNYNFTRWQLATAPLGAMLDGLGVNLNPAIIWNAIPFSFVVDWVFSVGKFLDQYTLHNMTPDINILRFLWSIKRERTITVFKEAFASTAYPQLMGTRISLPSVYESAYRRQVGIPTRSSIQLSGLTPSEFTLGAAMVIGRKARTHHRQR